MPFDRKSNPGQGLQELANEIVLVVRAHFFNEAGLDKWCGN
jgi:hypothetical protein